MSFTRRFICCCWKKVFFLSSCGWVGCYCCGVRRQCCCWIVIDRAAFILSSISSYTVKSLVYYSHVVFPSISLICPSHLSLPHAHNPIPQLFQVFNAITSMQMMMTYQTRNCMLMILNAYCGWVFLIWCCCIG